MAIRAYLAERALLPHGWARNVLIEVEPEGNIAGIGRGVVEEGVEPIRGIVLPGMVNLHSHAFQRAMAGLTQRLGMGEAADFWSWRRAMYAFAARLGPEEQRAIAAQLYVELLKGGYTTVVEFHYLHHGPDGRPYDDRAIMALALHEAALETGIALTLLPTIYMQADLDGAPLEGVPRRFALDPEGWARLAAAIEARFADDRNRALGLALHSLRAVPDRAIRAAVAAAGEGNPGRPIHIHLAEQRREVRGCLERFGRRPLDHLCAAAEVDHRWCLVHGTHLAPEELAEAGARHAVIGLCPTTEADLGDGAFPLADHLAADGAFGIGSDGNLCTRAPEELRLLEHGQRLATLRRTVAATPAQPHCGELLWCRALAGGAKAAGRPVGRLAPGFRADLIVLDAEHPSLYGREDAFLLDSLLFAPGAPIRDVMVGGLWCVRDGQHPAERTIAHAYRRALARLLA